MDTTTELPSTHPDGEMALFGYVIGAILLVVLLPLLPFLALAWLVWTLFGSSDPERTKELVPGVDEEYERLH